MCGLFDVDILGISWECDRYIVCSMACPVVVVVVM